MSSLNHRMMRPSCTSWWTFGCTSCSQIIEVARYFVVAFSGLVLSSSCLLTAALSDLVHACFSSRLHGGSRVE
eukprot:1874272-Prymnesium_polylepis.1